MPDSKVPRPGKYIDPLVDFAFKKIFGSEPNKDLLIAFLNEVFRGRKSCQIFSTPVSLPHILCS